MQTDTPFRGLRNPGVLCFASSCVTLLSTSSRVMRHLDERTRSLQVDPEDDATMFCFLLLALRVRVHRDFLENIRLAYPRLHDTFEITSLIDALVSSERRSKSVPKDKPKEIPKVADCPSGQFLHDMHDAGEFLVVLLHHIQQLHSNITSAKTSDYVKCVGCGRLSCGPDLQPTSIITLNPKVHVREKDNAGASSGDAAVGAPLVPAPAPSAAVASVYEIFSRPVPSDRSLSNVCECKLEETGGLSVVATFRTVPSVLFVSITRHVWQEDANFQPIKLGDDYTHNNSAVTAELRIPYRNDKGEHYVAQMLLRGAVIFGNNHYTTYALDDNGVWWLLDDDKPVQQSTWVDVQNKASTHGMLLRYEKHGEDAPQRREDSAQQQPNEPKQQEQQEKVGQQQQHAHDDSQQEQQQQHHINNDAHQQLPEQQQHQNHDDEQHFDDGVVEDEDEHEQPQEMQRPTVIGVFVAEDGVGTTHHQQQLNPSESNTSRQQQQQQVAADGVEHQQQVHNRPFERDGEIDVDELQTQQMTQQILQHASRTSGNLSSGRHQPAGHEQQHEQNRSEWQQHEQNQSEWQQHEQNQDGFEWQQQQTQQLSGHQSHIHLNNQSHQHHDYQQEQQDDQLVDNSTEQRLVTRDAEDVQRDNQNRFVGVDDDAVQQTQGQAPNPPPPPVIVSVAAPSGPVHPCPRAHGVNRDDEIDVDALPTQEEIQPKKPQPKRRRKNK